MLKIAVCDDNINDLKIIKISAEKCLKNLSEEYCIYEFDKGKDLTEVLNHDKIDILLLDIEMPDINGFEIAEKYNNKISHIIFVSCREDMVYNSFKYKPFRFVRKTHLKEIEEAILSAYNETKSGKNNLMIKDIQKGNVLLLTENIIYISSYRDILTIYCENEDYKIRSRMKNIINDLGNDFMRIHRGYIVNIRKIHTIKREYVEIIHNNSILKIPVKRNYYTEVCERFVELMKN